MNPKYLIAGQGLAGTVLAHHLIRQGIGVCIIDDPSLSSSSRVAAGLFNPVVFKRLVKSWMAEEQLAYASSYYAEMEDLLGAKFFYLKELVKLFAEDQEKTLWEKKRTEDVGHFLSPVYTDRALDQFVKASEGYAFVNGAGNLDIPLFLNLSRDYFKKQNLIFGEKLDHSLLQIQNGKIVYKNLNAQRIIFCEGHLASQNPWFNWMPFNLAKGEVLTVRIPGYTLEQVVNKGVFILPLSNELFRVGSTYAWDKLDELPTEAAREDLVQRLQKVLELDFEIVDHKAGIRPTVINRRPLIGVHPMHPELLMFNGMGSKGVMIAPLFSDHFIQHLETGIPLNKEVDIRRFWKG